MHCFRKAKTVRGMLAGIAIVLMTGPALAQSNVTFTLQMGGDNHAAQWEAGTPAFYTEGSTADGQTFGTGSVVSWGTLVSASGVQAAGNGAGFQTLGVANFVFDLELHQGSATGPLATAATFLSTINDGDAPAPAGSTDILAAASFALVYPLAGLGPGRVVDPQSGSPPPPGLRGGPHCGGVDTSADRLKSATYPTAAPGKLIGMGAGYNQWVGSGSSKTNYGIGTPTLGVKVLAEGQIDTTGLAAGTYVLKIIPGAGINVLRGDLNLNLNQNAFATAADTTTGDEIIFNLGCVAPGLAINPSPANGIVINDPNEPIQWEAGVGATSHDVYFGTTDPPPFVQNQAGTSYDPPSNLSGGTYFWRIDGVNACGTTTGTVWSFTVDLPLVATAWRSVRTHTGCGGLAIVLNPAAVGPGASGPVPETRNGGVQLIEVDFNKPSVLLQDPLITGSNSTSPSPTSATMTPDGLTLQIFFDPGVLLNEVCYTIDLTSAIMTDDFVEEISGDVDCIVRNLIGDVNGNGTVTLGDSLAIKSKVSSGEPVLPNNIKYDLNLSCTLSLGDPLLAKSKASPQTTACP